MSAEGLDELEIKLDQLADVDLNKAVGNAIQTVRSAAVMNVHVDTGELRQSIYAEVEDNGDTAIGVCWTNKPYATYLEFGTGPKGQRTMQAFHQRLHQPIRRIPGGSMKARWIGVWLRNTTGFTWILQTDAFICALDSPLIHSCIQH